MGELLVHNYGIFVGSVGIDHVILAVERKIPVVEMTDPEGKLVAPIVEPSIKGSPVDVRIVGAGQCPPVDRLVVVGHRGKRLALARPQQTLSIGLALIKTLVQPDNERLYSRLQFAVDIDVDPVQHGPRPSIPRRIVSDANGEHGRGILYRGCHALPRQCIGGHQRFILVGVDVGGTEVEKAHLALEVAAHDHRGGLQTATPVAPSG